MTPEITGIIAVVIVQMFMFAKILMDGKRKANESHLQSVEAGFVREQTRQDGELGRLRDDLKELRRKMDDLQERHTQCKQDLSSAETRLKLLEEFRNVVAGDSPTGATKQALPIGLS